MGFGKKAQGGEGARHGERMQVALWGVLPTKIDPQIHSPEHLNHFTVELEGFVTGQLINSLL